MANKRDNIPVATRRLVLQEACYKCGNPRCHTILTLEIHHLDYVSSNGNNEPENLLPLCPNCHTHHHNGTYPVEMLRGWKMILLALNEAFDRKSVDILLAIDRRTTIWVSGDGVLQCAALVASDLVVSFPRVGETRGGFSAFYQIMLSQKGKDFVAAWKEGNQDLAIRGMPVAGA